ncbi:MAG: hypothetical protein WA324_20270 [Bryobacteraceae bacterium]
MFTFRVTPEGALAYSGTDESFIVKPDAAQHRLNGDFTVSLKSSGERTLELTIFVKGKPVEIDAFTVSPDGQSLEQTNRNPDNGRQIANVIYRKQK